MGVVRPGCAATAHLIYAKVRLCARGAGARARPEERVCIVLLDKHGRGKVAVGVLVHDQGAVWLLEARQVEQVVVLLEGVARLRCSTAISDTICSG